ncbi:E3 ubiquitin-protein ligase RLIM-like isoform X2 [Cydia pomonella]|uniref:E3 ubiquitin-protein ligase RLIM-like isoform X2 n=1 Tax=Cydia pomonella TaxID=82600 RepID=UPI002ADE9318|nr:E3 ubiquitin-protein ligase RLIM-like isoform X2 [Cydia pomonella]
MSMREEDRQKNNNCPSRGLGLAAAALGVGVGAALYYFLSKKPENPDGEGSTTGWSCEQPHTFNILFDESDTSMENNCNNSSTSIEDSYTTISETTTTDTSIHSDSEDSYIDVIPNLEESLSFSEDEWDVTGSLDVPSEERSSVSPVRMMFGSIGALFSPRPSERRRGTSQEERDIMRAQAFRERSWSLEECSICFEIMLKDQDLTSLPCAHNFHSACLAPWLAEQQTCPNCRKAAE